MSRVKATLRRLLAKTDGADRSRSDYGGRPSGYGAGGHGARRIADRLRAVLKR